MNTYERHRHFQLRRLRTRRLRRRALLCAACFGFAILAWNVVSQLAPAGIAPPTPLKVGNDMLHAAVLHSAALVDNVHRVLRPDVGDRLRDKARGLFEPAAAPIVSGDSISASQHTESGPEFSDTGIALPVGRRFDVLLIGVDNRLGQIQGRTDALQLVSIHLDASQVEIIGIPRGTPSWLGFDSADNNIIANVAAARGRDELLNRVARLTGRDSLRYWLEIGFSDAIGVLELLGFDNPSEKLRALRRRDGYRYGDHTRSHNQARFVRNALLRVLPMLGEASGNLLITYGLRYVQSNLKVDECRGLALLLLDAGIEKQPERVIARVRSPYNARLADDAHAASSMRSVTRSASVDAERRIRRALERSRRAEPAAVVVDLWTLFQQHAWLQVQDIEVRVELRDAMAVQLATALTALGRHEEQRYVAATLEAEDSLFGALAGE
jgi:hypothetical protein